MSRYWHTFPLALIYLPLEPEPIATVIVTAMELGCPKKELTEQFRRMTERQQKIRLKLEDVRITKMFLLLSSFLVRFKLTVFILFISQSCSLKVSKHEMHLISLTIMLFFEVSKVFSVCLGRNQCSNLR